MTHICDDALVNMEHILDGCLSADASVRNQAEERLKSLEADMPAVSPSALALSLAPIQL